MIENTDDLPSLPNSWAWTRLEEIGIVASGGTPSTSVPEYFDGDVPWITPADLSSFTGKFIQRGRRNISEKGLHSSSAVLLPAGTILFSSRAPIGYVAIAANPIATNQGFKNLTLHEGVFNEYVFHYLKANKKLAESYGSGTTFREVSASRFRLIPIPLAPYNEQVRIVARLEGLFARLGAGVEGLRKVKVQLKRYRQAVLKYAFEGKLTEEHRDNSVCDEKLGWAIPADWGLKPAKELFYIKGRIGWRGLKKSHFTNEGPYLITGVDFTDGKIDWEKCYHIPLDKYLESPEIFTQKDDILLTKDGTIGKVAYVGHVPGGQASINAHILLIRNLQNNGIFAKFIYYMLQTRYFFDFVDLRKIGTTRPALTQRAFEEFPVFYPSLEKQKRIVEKIEDCLSIVDHIYETLKLSLTQARELRQSILEKAFRGELVPHDPHDEPAEQLLERIRVEMAKSQGGKDINKKKIKPKQLELSSYVK